MVGGSAVCESDAILRRRVPMDAAGSCGLSLQRLSSEMDDHASGAIAPIKVSTTPGSAALWTLNCSRRRRSAHVRRPADRFQAVPDGALSIANPGAKKLIDSLVAHGGVDPHGERVYRRRFHAPGVLGSPGAVARGTRCPWDESAWRLRFPGPELPCGKECHDKNQRNDPSGPAEDGGLRRVEVHPGLGEQQSASR